jgi:hypothetical protein
MRNALPLRPPRSQPHPGHVWMLFWGNPKKKRREVKQGERKKDRKNKTKDINVLS